MKSEETLVPVVETVKSEKKPFFAQFLQEMPTVKTSVRAGSKRVRAA